MKTMLKMPMIRPRIPGSEDICIPITLALNSTIAVAPTAALAAAATNVVGDSASAALATPKQMHDKAIA